MNAVIYQIKSSKGNESYIGSCASDIKRRWRNHINSYIKKKVRLCNSSIIFDKYGVDTCRIVILEELQYENKNDYLSRERYWIENTEDCVNQIRPFITPDEKIELDKQCKRKWQLDKTL